MLSISPINESNFGLCITNIDGIIIDTLQLHALRTLWWNIFTAAGYADDGIYDWTKPDKSGAGVAAGRTLEAMTPAV